MSYLGDAALWDALYEHVSGIITTPALRREYPGVPFTPTRNADRLDPYIRTAVLPSDSPVALLQVSVVWPDGEGSVAPVRVADQIAAGLALGTVIVVSDGRKIRVVRDPRIAAHVLSDGEIMIPVRVQWTPFV